MSALQGAARAFREISEMVEVPNWQEFNPKTIDTTKKHAFFMASFIGGKGVRIRPGIFIDTQEFFESITQFVNNHSAVKIVLIDREEDCIVISGVDGLEKAMKRETLPGIPSIILDGHEMKAELLDLKKSYKGLVQTIAVNEYLGQFCV